VTFIDNIEQIVIAFPLLAFGVVFLAGIISSASPCVPTTIPQVVGLVGGHTEGDRWKPFRYSLTFILGLSLTFTAFGAAAGLLGTMFGTVGCTGQRNRPIFPPGRNEWAGRWLPSLEGISCERRSELHVSAKVRLTNVTKEF
jgi:hypothetical protein